MRKNTVLIVDGGGRGAVLGGAYALDPSVGRIIAVPGNDLMCLNTGDVPVNTYPQFKTTSVDDIVRIAREFAVDLVDVAQDNAVERGLVDRLQAANIPVIGPTREAGRVEWDKVWAREFMQRHDIPHPAFHVFHSAEDGIRFVQLQPDQPWVIKAKELAEGKGVIVTKNAKEAEAAIRSLVIQFEQAAKTFLIENCLIGEEFSGYALSDGTNFRILGYAQDHKSLLDGDEGPNTGGMGCGSPPLVITPDIGHQSEDIFRRAFDSLRQEQMPYKGVLYLGGMVVDGKVFVIEFNARWGDPEAQVIVPGIQNDYFELNRAAIEGRIDSISLSVDKCVRVCVAGVSNGYPGDYSRVKGKQVHGIHRARQKQNVTVYGAGIKVVDNVMRAYGGRLFYVVGDGVDVRQARERAYGAMAEIHIEGNNLRYRTDIGHQDMQRLK